VCGNITCSSKTDNVVVSSIATDYFSLYLDSDVARIAYYDSSTSPNDMKVSVCSDAACSSLASTNTIVYAPQVYPTAIDKNTATGFPSILAIDTGTPKLMMFNC